MVHLVHDVREFIEAMPRKVNDLIVSSSWCDANGSTTRTRTYLCRDKVVVLSIDLSGSSESQLVLQRI